MSAYLDFLARKTPTVRATGFDRVPTLHPAMKPFQQDITAWALRRGSAALFEGTGLGKSLQQLVWGREVARHTQGRILGLTPLAVAHQTIGEAAKFDIPGVAYAEDQERATSEIVITNYDRIDRFSPDEFAGVFLDESSIIKAQDSKTRIALIDMFRDTPWKLACTATPAPNDYVELGNHAEFLGVATQKEMLATFFVHDGSVRASGNPDWRLKRHAEQDFWRWLSSWAVMIRSPRDLGYEEPGYDLPPLHKTQIVVPVEGPWSGDTIFPMAASTLSERISARRNTITPRCVAAARIVAEHPDRPWLIWCGLNDEADAMVELIPGAEQVAGSDDRDDKQRRLLGFVKDEPRILVSKPSIAGFGMNYQHCADMVFVGVNDSFEQLFQAIRRCWRFGQTRPVNVYLVASELEGAVLANLDAKKRDFERMCDEMAVHMRDLSKAEIRGGRQAKSDYRPAQKMEVPAWL